MSVMEQMLTDMLDESESIEDVEEVVEGDNPFDKKDKKDDVDDVSGDDKKTDTDKDDKDEKEDKDDMKENFTIHLDAIKNIFKDTDISEAKVEEIGTIFTAAVHSVVAENKAETVAKLEESLKAEMTERLAKIEESVDNYLTYSASEYMKENEIAIESGIKSELTESFLEGMKTLFTEHYVDMPEDKIDVVAGLSERLEESDEKMNNLIEENIEANNTINDFKKGIIVSEMTKDMTDTDREKITGLVESIEFKDVESFKTSVTTLKDNYMFENKEVKEEAVVINEDEKPSNTSAMTSYVSLVKSSF